MSKRRTAFTLIELMIVLVILAIATALALPMAETTAASKVIAAARLLVADIEYAQNDSITHPTDQRLLKVDQANDRYWVAAVSNVTTPISDPAGPGTLLVPFGSGRGALLTGVTIQSYALGGDDELRFNAFGVPDQTTTATIVLACDGVTMTISVDPAAGTVSAAAP